MLLDDAAYLWNKRQQTMSDELVVAKNFFLSVAQFLHSSSIRVVSHPIPASWKSLATNWLKDVATMCACFSQLQH
jgi:hypothetical protein